jgi:hypothetical protein
MTYHLLVLQLAYHPQVLQLAFPHHQNRQNQRHQLVLLWVQLEQVLEQREPLEQAHPVLIYIF